MAQRAPRLKSGVDVDHDFRRNAAPPETGRRQIASDRDRPPPEGPGGGSRGRDRQRVHGGRDTREGLTVQVLAGVQVYRLPLWQACTPYCRGRLTFGTAVSRLLYILATELDHGHFT